MIDKKIKELISLSYEGKFHLYHYSNCCLIQVFYPNEGQHREIADTLEEALDKTIKYLKS